MRSGSIKICAPETDSAEELCPSIFTLVDGLSFVRDPTGSVLIAGGDSSLADVPAQHIDAVLDAADECPGECIFVEA